MNRKEKMNNNTKSIKVRNDEKKKRKKEKQTNLK